MFAEELGGNASRKRAEEAKARRKRMKEKQLQQQRKEVEQKAAAAAAVGCEQPAVLGSKTADAAASGRPAVTPTIPVATAPAAYTSAISSNTNKTVVERAAEQRQLRAIATVQKLKAVTVQAFVRGSVWRSKLRKQFLEDVQGKLSDIELLSTIMLKKTKKAYTAPAATVQLLMRQFLFATGKGKAKPHVFSKLLQVAVLPGLREEDSNKGLAWVEGDEYRLKLFLSALLHYATQPDSDAAVSCLTLLLGQQYKSTCRPILLDNLDFLGHVRSFLLTFGDKQKKPIPHDAEEKRDACFATADKERAASLVQLVLDHASKPRIVREILTLPLLCWRLSAPTLSYFVASTTTSQPRIIASLKQFTLEYATALSDGNIGLLLESDDLPMNVCGATGAQRLLANLMQLGRLIPACNGTIRTAGDIAIATTFFQVVASLVDAVPVGTFLSSRESAIFWMVSPEGHHKPIVLSPIVLEQCKALLVDSYVRRVVASALDVGALDTDSILKAKNEKDLKHENDLSKAGNSSAASMAAKEARVDRTKNFWSTSKWARNLTKGVSNLFDADGKTKKVELKNTSSASRQLAEGSLDAAAAKKKEPRMVDYSPAFLFALCRTFSIVLARWGGGGNDDRINLDNNNGNNKQRKSGAEMATSTQEACIKSLLNVLCFSTPIVRAIWGLIQSDDAIVAEVYSMIDADKGKQPIGSLSIRPTFASENDRWMPQSRGNGAALLHLFLWAFSHVLIVTDDTEIHDMDRPLPMHQIRRCIQVLKKLMYRATCIDNHSNSNELPTYFGLALISSASRTMRDLNDRSSRRLLCVPTLWIVPSLLEKEIARCKTHKDYKSLLATSTVLRLCPYMVSFKRRLKLFERLVTTSRVEIQGENSSNPFHTNPLKPGIPVRITRGRLLEDGIATMNNLGPNMRERIAVQYFNEAGTRESGIDAGGLFKEFWTDLCAIAFDPNYALFRVTDSTSEGATAGVGNCLYPNPSSGAAHGDDHITLFSFLGRILGKALFEGITISPRFAHFFLSFLKGDYNFLHMLPDLSTVDTQLYNNLMFLKTYEGDASELCLTFTVTVDDFGGTRELPLMRNGADIDVTDSNKQLYIGMVAKYYVFDRIREQSEAMVRGLFEVVDRSFLRIFNEPELLVLISGASDGKLDVEDMKAHCAYAGGYSGIDRNVSRFWKVVASLDEKQQGELLRFVTSCERPPPLGFGSLNPPFTIQRVGIMRDGDRLPTASTCFNVLKLPTYSSEKVMKQRLLTSIQSGAGFELS